MTAPFRCRACGAHDVHLVLSLGETPLANALLTADELALPEDRFPLDVVRCRACSLVQITETVAPERLFREYAYFSSFSDTMLAHASGLVSRLVSDRGLDRSALAMEVASNDGYLLQFYRERGIPVLGVEPAENIAQVARSRGIDTVSEFFGADTAATLAGRGLRADVLHANNVLAHVPDLAGFIEGVRRVLKPHGLAVVEVPYLKELLDRLEFDTIYHEHLSYFSFTALRRAWHAGGLAIVDVERVAIHGGSLRLFIEPDHGQPASAAVEALASEEQRWGVDSDEAYARFASEVETLTRELQRVVHGLRADGARLAAYGAAAKGSTLLNVCGIDASVLEFVADRSPYKQGKYMPGVHVPILPAEHLAEAVPDYTLLLSWNFAEEILEQQQAYRRRGGRFVLPLPAVRIV